jgi:leucyl aminopeptidase (aminopeptidase T)
MSQLCRREEALYPEHLEPKAKVQSNTKAVRLEARDQIRKFVLNWVVTTFPESEAAQSLQAESVKVYFADEPVGDQIK